MLVHLAIFCGMTCSTQQSLSGMSEPRLLSYSNNAYLHMWLEYKFLVLMAVINLLSSGQSIVFLFRIVSVNEDLLGLPSILFHAVLNNANKPVGSIPVIALRTKKASKTSRHS